MPLQARPSGPWLGQVLASERQVPSDSAGLIWPTRPAGASTPLQGGYLTLKTKFNGSSLALVPVLWFFTANGRFAESPTGGFGFQQLASKAEPSAGEGSYWIDGQDLVMVWAHDAKTLRSPYLGGTGALRIGEQSASLLQGFQPGWRFEGRYESGLVSRGFGTIHTSNTLVFRSDGTFQRLAIGNVGSRGDGVQMFAGSQQENAGTYAFDAFTLTLVEAGQTTRYTVFALGQANDQGMPAFIYRDGVMMKRQPSP